MSVSSVSPVVSAGHLSATAWWGVAGTVALLVDAIMRLAPIAAEPLMQGGLSGSALVAYVAAIGFMAYVEGYRGFQLRFSPRVVARALAIGRAPWWCAPLAPVYCMGMVHATRRRLVGTWCLIAGIIAMVVMIRWLPQPWRGAIDAGVVVGLSWGSISILVEAARAVSGRVPEIDPDLPA